MATFSEKSIEAVTTILSKWADEQLAEALSNLSSAKLKSSGDLRNSLKYSIANEGGLKARLAVKYLYYGTIQDRDFIKFGKKGISTDRIEKWLKEDGMAKMGGYKGQSKNPERQIREVAWSIRKSWAKKGGRKGRKWNFRASLLSSSENLLEQIFAAFQQETYEAILSQLSEK
jgi:hypothetical protein